MVDVALDLAQVLVALVFVFLDGSSVNTSYGSVKILALLASPI